MARHTDTAPALTPGNRIYLYQLLASQLGCGKQTFLPAVEEALASDRMGAEDLGYESTRALLEALEEFVKLTVFKGGRIYATVIAQPGWDAALEAAAAGKPAPNGKTDKPWKRKKTDKSLKPVRPKRVKKPEPEAIAEPEPEAAPQPEVEPDVEVSAKTAVAAEAKAPAGREHAGAGETKPEPDIPTANGAVGAEAAPAESTAGDQGSPADDANLSATTNPEPLTEPEASEFILEPAISLTVTFDPYNGIVEETKMESHPVAPKPTHVPQPTPAQTAEPAPVPLKEKPISVPAGFNTTPVPQPADPASGAVNLPASSCESAAAPATGDPSRATAEPSPTRTPAAEKPAALAPTPTAVASEPEPIKPAASPELLATYPVDFATEVYLDSERIAELCELLPYGTDVFTLLAEDYTRARGLELISGTRARATFPLRIQHIDSTEPLTITLKKRSGSELKWELSQVE